MRKKLNLVFAAIVVLGFVGATAAAFAAPAHSSVSLNVRAGPGTNYKVIGVLDRDEPVTIRKCLRNRWCNISFRGRAGWASSAYLARAESQTIIVEREPEIVVVEDTGPQIVVVEAGDEIAYFPEDDDVLVIYEFE